MNQLDYALKLARKGFYVFPLKHKTKKPAWKDFTNKATRDETIIKKVWASGLYNVGIATTKFKDNQSLIVIDVDNKGQKKGNQSLVQLEMDGNDFPKTLKQITPTKGSHLFYVTDKPVKQGVNVLGDGLDIRSKGGYVVGAGSELENGHYTLIDDDLVPAPDWLVKRFENIVVVQDKKPVKNVELDRKESVERAIDFLEKAEPAVEGQGGNHHTYKIAAQVKDLGISQKNASLLMSMHFNPKCLPPWQDEELDAIVANAYSYGAHPIGHNDPTYDFTPFDSSENSLGINDEINNENFIQIINKTFAVIYLEGSNFVIEETINEKGKPKLVFHEESSFKRKFSPYRVQVSKAKTKSYAELWLDSPSRREYQGVCFAPEREPKHGYYNLWRGFALKEITFEEANADQKRGLEMYLNHIRTSVCAGNEMHFNFVIGWLAHMIQRPYERPRTTLVFKGEKGVGKSFIFQRIQSIIGRYYLEAAEPRYLVSNFNGHLDSLLMMVLDEAVWAGDKVAEGKLKALTTQPEIIIERKGKEPYTVDNLVRLVLISNEDWVVPASADERRYAIFEVSGENKQNKRFFDEMAYLIDHCGGDRLLLHFLKTFDLSSVDINTIPKTDALLDQKIRSASLLEEYIYESLKEGRFLKMDSFSEGWPDKIKNSEFKTALNLYYRERNVRSRTEAPHRAFKMISNMIGELSKIKAREGSESHWFYCVPSLELARANYSKYIGHKLEWD